MPALPWSDLTPIAGLHSFGSRPGSPTADSCSDSDSSHSSWKTTDWNVGRIWTSAAYSSAECYHSELSSSAGPLS